jgi:glycosyltransferase involved in cell wall biosynthesis
MPVKNAEPYLRPCLESIASQSNADWELIAVNDGSEDRSETILLEFASNRPNVQVINNKGTGIVDALKLAYAYSNGDYVHRMDADDIMPVNKLKMMLDAWRPNSIVTGKVKYFSDKWLVSLGFQNYESWLNRLMDSENIWQDVYMECTLPSPAWLMHRDDFESLGAFNSDLLPEDYDLCFRVYKSGLKVIHLKNIIHLWRDSQNRTSRKLPVYFPMAYYPLKVHYFLDIDRNSEKPLLVWGAGKKGKRMAQLLKDRSQYFLWATANEKKIGADIYGTIIQDINALNLVDYQIIIAVSSPEDKPKIQLQLNSFGVTKSKDYFWFC